MTFTLTPEQQAIVFAARSTRDNLIINALAGAAKTSTLELIAHALPGEPTLFLAFNKRIADEAAKRLPSHVEVRTLNALGHRVWSQATGRRLTVKSSKMGDLYQEHLAALKGAERAQAWEERADILDLLRIAKRDGYIPPQARKLSKWGAEDEWWDGLEEEVPPRWRNLINGFLAASVMAAYQGLIDYDDQLYMPVCFGASWPKYPLILVDEAQDLSPINHQMLQALFYKRIIAVGDPWQSIYGFRGSVFNGMTLLRERFAMEAMDLSVTFRVPQAGVIRARERVPHMQWKEGAKVGRIERLDEWTAASVPPYAAIICRNNAPLFTCALRLLKAGRKITLVGMDIGPGLLRIMRKLGPPNATNLDDLVEQWASAERNRSKRPERVDDKAECLAALCAGRDNLAEAIRWTEDLFKQEGDIQLLSGHKAKGLEWDTVFHLDPWRIPSRYATSTEEKEQELNVKYVIETRFKDTLFLVDLEGLR